MKKQPDIDSARRRLSAEGFTVVPGVIGSEALEKLRGRVALFYRGWDRLPRTTRKEITGPSTGGTELPVKEINWPEAALRLLDYEPAVAAVRRVVDAVLETECKLIHANSLLKPARYGTAIAPHQDTAYNVQPLERPVTAWIPFEDVTEQGGGIFYLPGSHQLGELEHASENRVRWLENDVLGRVGDRQYSSYEGPAGSIGIHDSRIVHGSYPNRSPRDRLALSLRFVVELP